MGEASMDCTNLGKDFTYSDEVSEMIFGFLEDDEFSVSSFESRVETIDEEEEDEENTSNFEESKAFWESQDELLQATLYRTTAVESKIRQATKDALVELDSIGVKCSCPKMVADSCRFCRQKEICDRLQTAGFNCVICKSKWKSSLEIPAGEHTYLEVQSFSKKGEVKVIIELNFRAEFQISRSSEEYNRLIKKLPDIFVGKIERLRNLIKILCSACKESMKERKMHMAPWRKHKYMQAKWLGTPQVEAAAVPPILTAEHDLQRIPKPRASMLTFDLFDNLPGMYSKAIRVI
ncbi:uncharacterized protein LOC111370973 [Olea europaea var. sylvestris]|uniref:Uncharacterized protein n=1 Tax=Olea europaea subsp. europaea TaxID=158383 RepID=A0A8S0RQ26_OLEEU|nr:uncharacterized protein LOC111370973 [Olea europaea var. sylvestris]CAA2981411.1 Hypothetical predicted protein [Olea europaea subsp. europaea]